MHTLGCNHANKVQCISGLMYLNIPKHIFQMQIPLPLSDHVCCMQSSSQHDIESENAVVSSKRIYVNRAEH